MKRESRKRESTKSRKGCRSILDPTFVLWAYFEFSLSRVFVIRVLK